MKKITFISTMALALLIAVPAQAQFSWGIKGGVNMVDNSLSSLKNVSKDNVTNANNYTGFFIGPKAELRIPLLGLGVEGAALYSQKGMKLEDGDTFKQNSFEIPVNVKYGFGLGNIANVFVAAGPQFGFNVGETTKFIQSSDGSLSGYFINKSTLSINVGVGATLLNHLQVGINYNIPWGKTADFKSLDKEDLDAIGEVQAADPKKVTVSQFEEWSDKISNLSEGAKTAAANIKAATLQISVAYLF